jgi:probable rRNA maturation factor
MIDIDFIIEPIPNINSEFFILSLPKLVQLEDKECGPINLIFCDDEKILEVNKEYLAHDYYTDIITFDYSLNQIISGDLFISIDRVKENADMFSKSFENELTRVVFHGVLHLCGYNDKSEEDVLVMRSKEDYYLTQLVSCETTGN